MLLLSPSSYHSTCVYINIYTKTSTAIGDLEKRLLSDINLKPYIRRDINDIFLIWEHVEESLKLFLEKINPTVRFTADCSYSLINVLDVKVILKDRNIITDLYVKPTHSHQCLDSSSCYPRYCKKNESLRARLCGLIESVLKMPSLIRDVTN